jgi:hypothetical protein
MFQYQVRGKTWVCACQYCIYGVLTVLRCTSNSCWFWYFSRICSVAVDAVVFLGRSAASVGDWCRTFRAHYSVSKCRTPIIQWRSAASQKNRNHNYWIYFALQSCSTVPHCTVQGTAMLWWTSVLVVVVSVGKGWGGWRDVIVLGLRHVDSSLYNWAI